MFSRKCVQPYNSYAGKNTSQINISISLSVCLSRLSHYYLSLAIPHITILILGKFFLTFIQHGRNYLIHIIILIFAKSTAKDYIVFCICKLLIFRIK